MYYLQVRDASEQKVDGGDSLLEEVTTKDALQTIDLPPKIETKPQEIVDPKPVRESTSESKENEAVHDSHTVKQPLPRNPLVQDKSVLDKTKVSTKLHMVTTLWFLSHAIINKIITFYS